MHKTENVFATVTRAGAVQRIDRSIIEQPKINFAGGAVHWFDDSKLKKGGANHGR